MYGLQLGARCRRSLKWVVSTTTTTAHGRPGGVSNRARVVVQSVHHPDLILQMKKPLQRLLSGRMGSVQACFSLSTRPVKRVTTRDTADRHAANTHVRTIPSTFMKVNLEPPLTDTANAGLACAILFQASYLPLRLSRSGSIDQRFILRHRTNKADQAPDLGIICSPRSLCRHLPSAKPDDVEQLLVRVFF